MHRFRQISAIAAFIAFTGSTAPCQAGEALPDLAGNFNLVDMPGSSGSLIQPAGPAAPEQKIAAKQPVAGAAPAELSLRTAVASAALPAYPRSAYTGRIDAGERRLRAGNETMELAFHLLNAADAVQTLVLTSGGKHREGNPIFGSQPKPAMFLGIKGAASVVHYLVYRSMRHDPRATRKFEVLTLSVQGGFVLWNLKMAI